MARTNPKSKAPGKARRGKGKGRGKRTAKNLSDIASLSVNRTYTANGGGPPTANVMYSLMNTTLSQFDRAVQVGKAYQFYRIKNITIKVKPQFDTYAFGVSGYGKPKLYHMFDKSGSLPTNVSLESLKQAGARPRNLDENALSISWAPSVLTSAMTAGGAAPTVQPSAYKVGAWLTTNANTITPGSWVPNDIDHLGVYWTVDATSYGGTGGLPYQIDVEVQFQFKKALWNAVSTTEAISIVPAILDASPDGIEGGSDGITIPLIAH